MEKHQLTLLLLLLNLVRFFDSVASLGEQPLAQIAIHKATFALDDSAKVIARPFLLGRKVSHISADSISF